MPQRVTKSKQQRTYDRIGRYGTTVYSDGSTHVVPATPPRKGTDRHAAYSRVYVRNADRYLLQVIAKRWGLSLVDTLHLLITAQQ